MIKTGRVKLIEFEIGHSTPRPPSNGDTITARAIGVGGIKISFAGATGCHDDGLGADGFYLMTARIEYISTYTPPISRFPAMVDDEVNRAAVGQ